MSLAAHQNKTYPFLQRLLTTLTLPSSDSDLDLHFNDTPIPFNNIQPQELQGISQAINQRSFSLSSETSVSLLEACTGRKTLAEAKQTHSHMLKSGIPLNAFLGTKLVNLYASCGAVKDARLVFDKLKYKRNPILWNAMIKGYVLHDFCEEGLALYDEMHKVGMEPDSFTFPFVLKACGSLGDVERGKGIHKAVVGSGFEANIYVGTALIDMYVKCGEVEVARQVFDKMPQRNVVSWTAMICGYAQNGRGRDALALFQEMQLEGIKSNSVTIVSVLPAASQAGSLQWGSEIHAYLIKNEFRSELSVANAVVDMYAKCGSIRRARQVFDKMSERDVVSFNAIVGGYVHNGYADEALKFFHQMPLVDVKPDSVTITSVLRACSCLTALQQGKDIHDYAAKNGFDSTVSVGNALIDMYAKCGSIDIACKVFEGMSERNVISWTAIIGGYGLHGRAEEALKLFDKMKQFGPKPNHITFVAVLSACSHAGLVHKGRQYFECMSQDYQILPQLEHYACMVDLLGRAGHLDEAYDFIKNMHIAPDAAVWGALLGACRIYCNTELGKIAAEHVIELKPRNSGFYVLLSNIYAKAGRWDDVARVRTLMKQCGIRKNPGRSWIEIKNNVHTFFVGDRSHPESETIYAVLDSLSKQIKDIGYVPDTRFVLHDLGDDEKECALSYHSEKIAIAFGLIKTCPGSTIRIGKNLRICGDCHVAIKFISIVVGREIIVRDANRFHHFKEGHCSCGDYW